MNVDGVKYQLVYADELSTPDYIHYKLFKSLEMNISSWKWAVKKLRSKNKKIYFDIFGPRSFQVAKKLSADGVKISTTEFYNTSLVNDSLRVFDEVLISLGGIPWKDVKKFSYNVPKKYNKKITFMYGLQSEPTMINENNILKLKSLMQKLNHFKFGFMDHSHGGKNEALYLSLLTIGLNIDLIEKHFTLDRSLKIEDYISGITEKKFRKFVDIIRHYEKARGNESLSLSTSEIAYGSGAIKVVVAQKDIKKDSKLKISDIALKRTKENYNDDQYRRIEEVIGKKINRNIRKNNLILKGYI